ncbi:MAG: hypothetical protein ACQEQJ_09135 [Halobacteriota archaeon]
MAVLTALRQTPGAVWRNPAIALPLIALVLLQAPSFAAELLDPFLAVVLSLGLTAVFVFLIPFFQGGIIGMADEALDGSTSLGTFLSAGKSNYLSIFGAYLLLLAVNVVFGIGVFFAFFLGIGAAYVGGDGGGGGASVAVVAAIGLLALVVYLLFNFFVQFYSQAIVVDAYGAIGGLKRSFGVVRGNLLATLGYSLLAGAIAIGFGLFVAVLSVFASPTSMATLTTETPPLAWFAGVGLVGGLLTVVLGTFLAVFAVAFYREIAAESGPQQRPAPEL